MIDINKVKEELKMYRSAGVKVPDDKVLEVGEALYRELCSAESCEYVYVHIDNDNKISHLSYNIGAGKCNLAALIILFLGLKDVNVEKIEKILENIGVRAVVVVGNRAIYVLVLRPKVVKAKIVSEN